MVMNKKTTGYQIKKLGYQTGYSMLELLVAMTMGILILASAVTMQVSNRTDFRNTASELEMKTNAKLAAEFIGNSLRGVGSMGCRTVAAYHGGTGQSMNESAYRISLLNDELPWANFNAGHEIQGYQAVGAGWVPTPDASLGLTGMLPGSDALTLRGAIGESYVLQPRNIGDTAYFLDIPAGTDVRIARNNFAVASTCKDAEIFRVTSSDAVIDTGVIGRAAGGAADENEFGTWTQNQGISRSIHGELSRVATVTYYVANNDRGVPTLFRSIDGDTPSPLVEGVERMKLDYGIEDDAVARNVASRYLTASQIQSTCNTPMSVPVSDDCLWPNVVSVRVSLIMRSDEQIYGKAIDQSYTLPGADPLVYEPTDRFSRAIYSSTFVVRNRMIGDRIQGASL
jgi:type IV pilus assembly protein PilW